jgi:hypothetical protein
MIGPHVADPELLRLIAESVERYEALSPEQRLAHDRAQRRSWILAEAGFGSDADEAAYRVALERGDWPTMIRLDEEAEERRKRAEEFLARAGPL